MMGIIGAGILCTVCYYLLGELGFRHSKLFLCFCFVVMTCSLLDSFAINVLPLFDAVSSKGTVGVGKTVLKIVGIGYAMGVCRDFCDTLGASSISGVIDLTCKVEVLGIISPYLSELFESAAELLL